MMDDPLQELTCCIFTVAFVDAQECRAMVKCKQQDQHLVDYVRHQMRIVPQIHANEMWPCKHERSPLGGEPIRGKQS